MTKKGFRSRGLIRKGIDEFLNWCRTQTEPSQIIKSKTSYRLRNDPYRKSAFEALYIPICNNLILMFRPAKGVPYHCQVKHEFWDLGRSWRSWGCSRYLQCISTKRRSQILLHFSSNPEFLNTKLIDLINHLLSDFSHFLKFMKFDQITDMACRTMKTGSSWDMSSSKEDSKEQYLEEEGSVDAPL